MVEKITEHSNRTERQRESSSQTNKQAGKGKISHDELRDCDESVRQPSQCKNSSNEVETMVQQRQQQYAQKNVKKRNRSIKAADLFELLEKQQYLCSLSGVELTPENVSCDHVLALEKGGKHDVSNLQLVHRIVNRMKTTMTQDEFIGWCKLISENNGS